MIIAVIYYPGRFSLFGMGSHVAFAAHDYDPYPRRTTDGVFLNHGGTGSHCANKKYYGGKPKIILLPVPARGITLDKLNDIISNLYDVRGNYNLLRNNCAHMVAAMLAEIYGAFGEIFRTDCSRLALTPEKVANHAEVLEGSIKEELGDDLYSVCYVDPDQESIKLFHHALENEMIEVASPAPIKLAPLVGQQFQSRSEEDKCVASLSMCFGHPCPRNTLD